MLSARRRLVLLGGLLVAGSITAALAGAPSSGQLEDGFADTGLAGAAGYAALYAGLTVALVPGAALTIAAGVLFGPVAGTLVSLVGATTGATAAFWLARRTSRSAVEDVESERLAKVEARLRENGLLSMIVLRLIPVAPFNLLNYLAGASAISTRDYVVGTAIGIIPGAAAYATLGGSIGDPGSPAFIGALALAVLLTVSGVLVARRA